VYSQVSLIGYGLAAATFAALTVLLLTTWRGRTRGGVLPLACVASAIWAGMHGVVNTPPVFNGLPVFVAEIAFDGVWLVFLASLMGGAVTRHSNWLVRRGGMLLVFGLLAVRLLTEFSQLDVQLPGIRSQLLVAGSIATSLFGLVGIEQVYRNARPQQKRGLKYLCLGLAGFFVYDLFVYSHAAVTGQVSQVLWDVRGFVIAMCVPLIALSVGRSPSWTQGIFASRKVVFFGTTLVASGLYLAAIVFAGKYIQHFGPVWGPALQILFFCAAVLVFLIVLLSAQARAKMRVLVTKHFFEKKYDYRAEWLRLNETLSAGESRLPLRKRAIQSLAQIIDSPAGHLWLLSDNRRDYHPVAGWNASPMEGELTAKHAFIRFLAKSGWIIDLHDVRSNPDRYQLDSAIDIEAVLGEPAFVVPLFHERGLIGFVALSGPRSPTTLNFEDHDLLKTAGQQVASYLAREASTEQLAESRQFEAFSRFTAYVMHDLKNAIAQQTLVVKNAVKHKRNPAFVDDAIETVKGSVARMSRVMSNLQQHSFAQATERVDLVKLVLQAASQCSDRSPTPTTSVPDGHALTTANRDRLLMAICHAIRNAQDATEADGEIHVELTAEDGECCIVIADTGCGMEAEFVRERLFRPFDSTKGAEGMGIGAYQIRETLRMSGGDVHVDSVPQQGTRLSMHLPLVDRV